MKQMQVCYQMYHGDNNDFLPPNATPVAAETNSWIQGNAQSDTTTANLQLGVLFPYNKSTAIYVCPSDRYMINAAADPLHGHPTAYTAPQTRTCSINFKLGGLTGSVPQGGTYNGVTTLIKNAQVYSASKMICFVDESEYGVDDGCFGINMPGTNTYWNLPGIRHNNGAIFSFTDGHEEYRHWHGAAIFTDSTMSASTIQAGFLPADNPDISWLEAGMYP